MADTGAPGGPLQMLEGLLRRTHLSTAADLATIAAEEARAIGARSLVLHLADYEQTELVPVPAPDAAGREPLAIQGTVAGRVFATAGIVGVEGDGHRLWLPLLDGTDRLGVMELVLPEAPPADLTAMCERYAHLVSMLLVSKAAYSDSFERLRRRRPMTVASDLLHDLTPPAVLATDDLVLGAMLEPAYDMGGDAFDYALDGRCLHLGVFDAMGHGLSAAGVAAFALAAHRNARRSGAGLAEGYDAIDAAVAEQYPDGRFATAVLAQLDVDTGQLRWISGGHPPPLLVRGGRLVKTLGLQPSPPLGTRLAPGPPAEGREALEPGDMVLFYTDGLTEARRADGELLTVERLGEFIEREAASGEAAPETLRRLRQAIVGGGEVALRDDATALLLEWRRGSERTLLPQTV